MNQPLTTDLPVWLVNLDNFRRRGVEEELQTLAALKPAVIAQVEAIGNPQPDLPGYVHIGDDSNDSRRNIAVYVRADLAPTRIHWHDCRFGWPRTKGPARDKNGRRRMHEPRSFVSFRIGRVKVVVAHQPPPGATMRAKLEHLARVAAVLNRVPGVPTILLWDGNGYGKRLARLTGMSVYGWRVDQGLARGLEDVRFRYVESWPRTDRRELVVFGGDHGHVWRGLFTVASKYLPNRLKETA